MDWQLVYHYCYRYCFIWFDLITIPLEAALPTPEARLHEKEARSAKANIMFLHPAQGGDLRADHATETL